MRVPSNRMHKIAAENDNTATPSFWFGFAVIVVVLLGFRLWQAPWHTLATISFVALFTFTADIWWRRRCRPIASQRPDESICTFARSFDCRKTDTWIIRAVYEQFQPYADFPLRTSDRWAEDLRVDPDDVEDIVVEIARLTSRSLDDYEQNPVYAKLETLADLVAFFSHQPRTA